MSSMNELPGAILPTIAEYLPHYDAFQLSGTSKKFYLNVPLTATSPRQIVTKFYRQDRNDDLHYGFHIPVPSQVKCRSMSVTMLWKDQGWGNRKGRVFVVAEEKDHTYDRSSQNFEGRNESNERFGGGRVEYASVIAPHEDQQRLCITFQPKEDEMYHLWYAVGGGGGHSLHLSNVMIQAFVLDDPYRCFGRAHSFLARADALPAWDALSRSIICLDIGHVLLSQEHFGPPQITDADRNNISEADLQVKVMGYITALLKCMIDEHFAYATIMADSPGMQEGPRFEDMWDDDFLEDRMDFGEFLVPEDDGV